MALRQLFQDLKSGETFLAEVSYPACGSRDVVIQSAYSLVSPGTERMLVDFGRASYLNKARQQPDKVKQVIEKVKTEGVVSVWNTVNAKLSEPMGLGYCNAGVVLEVGRQVEHLKPGDRVVSNGAHSEIVCVNQNLVAKVPEGVDLEQASFTVIASIALNGVRILAPALGETVAVVGLGLIGQITLDLVRASGAIAIGLDVDPNRVALARQRGFLAFNNAAEPGYRESVLAATQGQGCDGVIITASAKSNGPIEDACALARKRGKIIGVGAFGMDIPRAPFYEKELTFQIATSYGPGRYDPAYESRGIDYPFAFVRWTENRNFQSILDLLQRRVLDFGYLIHRRTEFDQAAKAYSEGLSDPNTLGIVLKYRERQISSPLKRLDFAPVASRASGPDRPGVGVIGSGNFTKVVILPALGKARASLIGIASSKGTSSAVSGRKFGAQYATTDHAELLRDSKVNAVFITTRHGSHAHLAIEAMRAGKAVFVEKPLAVDLEQLAEVVRVRRELEARGQAPLLMVGFNRRFSPFVEPVKKAMGGGRSPIALDYLVNAGAIPAESWVHDPQDGGGRLIGEGCHFIDLMSHVCGSPVRAVTSTTVGAVKGSAIRADNVVLHLEFANDSAGTLHYIAQGHKGFPKERLVVMGGGRVAEIDNFRRVNGYGFAGLSKFRMDKGHQSEIEAFLQAVRAGTGELIPFASIVNTTLATFAHVRSLEQRRRVAIEELEDELQKLL